MKLTIDHAVLAEAVAWAAHALTPRPAVPVLTGLLLEADGDELTISAFDYDTSRRISIGADVAEPGRVLLPGRVLAEVTKALPKKPVTLNGVGPDPNEIVITCGSTEFVLLTMPVDDYPTLPTPPDPIGDIDAHTLTAAVGQVAPATSRDDSLPMLSGIRIDADGDTMTLAATDRYRIAARTTTWTPAEPDTLAEVMIPGRAFTDIAKSLPDGPISIGLGNGLAAFTGSGRIMTVRLLDDQFIDYNARLSLADWTTWADVDTAPLIAAIKRVALVSRGTAVRLTFRDDQALVQGGDDTGRASESLPADLDGPSLEIAFQPQFLLDGLNGVDGGRARIGMTSPSKPALVVEPGHTPAYRYLVMALRLS